MTDTGPTEVETPEGLLGWCLVANVARETAHGESGLDIQHGTKHFRTGALLACGGSVPRQQPTVRPHDRTRG
ncbi:hypothetical protein ACFY1B_50440 [Streptomyces mirabilis]|uniref:hypothetical protein n=1 Tax=Streptomyces TaxID=1883 RepID=UPI0029A9AA2A|nr:hypothetical protein [Streptomyces sp. AK02-04a]MDX3762429.1 hypothetical protein [Streptomyces sp. AK02-04a]